jgi:hypothetical protein
VALCIVAGIALGQLAPATFHWLMIAPMLIKADFGALNRVAGQWRGIAVTVGINWLVKPFSMALCRNRLRAEPGPRGAARCRLPVGPDRGIEFLRVGGGCGDRAVRL